MCREDDHFGVGINSSNDLQDLQSIHVRQIHIHHRSIRLELAKRLNALETRRHEYRAMSSLSQLHLQNGAGRKIGMYDQDTAHGISPWPPSAVPVRGQTIAQSVIRMTHKQSCEQAHLDLMRDDISAVINESRML